MEMVGSDISSSNVLLEAADSASWTDDDIYEYFGEPHTDKIFYASGKRALEHAPRRIVEDVYYSAFDAEHFTGRIVLADFGVAFRTTAAHGLPAARAELPAFHPAYLAPELLFGCAPSPASDVWALACVLFELIGCAGQLFPCVAHGLAALGALPQAWRGATSKFRLQWLKRRQDRGTDEKKNIGYWLDDSKWYDSSRAPERPLDKLVAERLPWFSERETAAMLDLLRGALVYEPQKRVSAAAIAAHPFLDPTLWGMPVEQDDEPDYTIGGS
jgi:serine/threonine protein kinase